jgi:hypothetical protein
MVMGPRISLEGVCMCEKEKEKQSWKEKDSTCIRARTSEHGKGDKKDKRPSTYGKKKKMSCSSW